MIPSLTLILFARLAIRYELQTNGSQLTMEKAQVLESKHSCLQNLIEMFEHQADSYILHHKALENVQIASLTDYIEFDNADNLDDSEVQTPVPLPLQTPHHYLQSSDSSGMDDTNAEDTLILLPSSLGWAWLVLP